MIPEELLCAAAAGSCDAYVSYLEADYDAGEPYEFSKAFEKRIDRLKRRADHPVFYQTVRRVAIILIAILFAGTIWIAVDSDARAAFVGWFGEFTGYYYEYHHVGAAEKAEEKASAPAEYRPTWIPEGYETSDVLMAISSTIVVYANEDGQALRFIYLNNSADPTMFLDATDTERIETTVRNDAAMLFVSQSEATASAVTWSAYDDTMFFISGFVSEEELLKMAESVQRIIYLPAWIPEGYAEKSVRVFNDKTTVLYVNDSGELLRFSYVITNREYHWSFDTHQGETVDGQVGDRPAILFRSHDEKTASAVTWIGADDTAFYVTGFISEEDLLRMAESVDQP